MEPCYILGLPYPTDQIEFLTQQLIYTSYRIGFPEFTGTLINTDIGWGCTLRSGQMLLANTFLRSKGDTLLYKNSSIPKFYYQLISLFYDHPSSLFSIQRLLQFYPMYDKQVGDWIGPYELCDLLSYFSPTITQLYHINYKMVRDRILATGDFDFSTGTRYLVAIPVRLGLRNIEKVYHRNILHYTTLPYFMGIVGGTENQSYYLYGSAGQQLLYLDPHFCQPYCGNTRHLTTYNSLNVNYLDLEDLSPTFSICFYLQTASELTELGDVVLPDPSHPLFEVRDGQDVSVEIVLKSASDSGEDEWNLVDTTS